MARLQYIGKSHFRTISAADLKSLGFEGASKIELARETVTPQRNPKNLPSVAEVSEEIAEFLVKREKGDWKILADDETPVTDPAPDAFKVGTDGTVPGAEGVDDTLASDAGSGEKPSSKSASSRAPR